MSGANSQDRRSTLEAEAAHWFALRRETGISPAQEQAFRTWRDADPAHAAAYKAVRQTFKTIAAEASIAELEPLPARPSSWRRVAVAGAALAAAAVGALLVAPSNSFAPAPLEPHRTDTAQTQTLHLSDGSLVHLGAASLIDVRFSDHERRVVVLEGEAFFDLAPDPARPFIVIAGETRIRDIGTRFNVNRGPAGVHVAVSEGAVEIDMPPVGLIPRRPAPILLRAGERAEAPAERVLIGATPTAEALPAIAPGAWREGRLVYDDVRLGDLAADLSRYYAPGVSVRDPALAELRLAASFKATEIETFLATLPSAAPVAIERRPDGAIILRSRRD